MEGSCSSRDDSRITKVWVIDCAYRLKIDAWNLVGFGTTMFLQVLLHSGLFFILFAGERETF